jgi:hypothetical protein
MSTYHFSVTSYYGIKDILHNLSYCLSPFPGAALSWLVAVLFDGRVFEVESRSVLNHTGG